ncbi:terpene synthase family protein [Kitasatospora sp. NPDC008050]|uniref:terpene synthase family protein n=1 Tax=Kitasatospora sp. NPDC008050 TaxID=3364021 RepID=UPI0036F01E9D
MPGTSAHSSTPSLGLPPLYCPLAPSSHPEADTIDKRAAQWMDRCPIPDDPEDRAGLLGSRSAAFVANSSPQGYVDRLEATGRWFFYAFAMDDWFESCASPHEVIDVCAAMQRALEAPDEALSDTPFMPAYLDIVRTFRGFATPVQYGRVTAGYRIYHQSIPWEMSYRLRGRLPDLNTQLVLRLGVSGFEAFFAMIEVCNGQEMTAREYDDPALRALREIAGLLLLWINDLSSFAKDARAGDGQNNLVIGLMNELRCPKGQAVVQAIGIWNRSMALFIRLRDQLAAHASPQLGHFLTDLGNMVANVVHWHRDNPRYAMAAPALEVTTTPPPGLDPAPLPYPSIAWWWQHLTP